VLKKVIGLIFLAAVVIGGFVLWQNPAMLAALMNWVQSIAGQAT